MIAGDCCVPHFSTFVIYLRKTSSKIDSRKVILSRNEFIDIAGVKYAVSISNYDTLNNNSNSNNNNNNNNNNNMPPFSRFLDYIASTDPA